MLDWFNRTVVNILYSTFGFLTMVHSKTLVSSIFCLYFSPRAPGLILMLRIDVCGGETNVSPCPTTSLILSVHTVDYKECKSFENHSCLHFQEFKIEARVLNLSSHV